MYYTIDYNYVIVLSYILFDKLPFDKTYLINQPPYNSPYRGMIDWLGIHLMTRHTCSHNEDMFYVVYLDTRHESPISFTRTAHHIIKHEVLKR